MQSNSSYKPLDKTKNEIRVIRFPNPSSPISANDIIQCSIENVPLRDATQCQSHHKDPQNRRVWDAFTAAVDLRDAAMEQTPLDDATSLGLGQKLDRPDAFRYQWGDYEALSYTWGRGNDMGLIMINGEEKKVTKNLEAALRAMRDLKETRLGMCYWADSLCINQDDIKEREEQVKRMTDIYSKARAVIVWLGQEEGTDKDAVESMRYLCRHRGLDFDLCLRGDLLLTGQPALEAFVKKPYWNRSWIIQELATNHNSTLILCGKFKLTRRMVRLGAIYLQVILQGSQDQSSKYDIRLESDVDVSQNPSYDYDRYMESTGWFLAGRTYCLMNIVFNAKVGARVDGLMNLVRQADATDPKDKVYGILGLLDPAISAEIVPDYSPDVPIRQVYTALMASIIKTENGMEQIVFGGNTKKKEWPSWVPDLRLPFERRHMHHLRNYRASGALSAKANLSREKYQDILVCKGFEVDLVDGIAARTFTTRDRRDTRRNVTQRYGKNLSKAIQRTLVMDHPGVPTELSGDTELSVDMRLARQHRENPKTHLLSKSNYYREYQIFVEQNKEFCIGNRILRKEITSYYCKADKFVDVSALVRLILLSLHRRALVTTRKGYVGLVPDVVRPGDVVVILLGCRFPVVLRPRGESYQVVGECYVHGLMDGEILSQGDGKTLQEREFRIF